MYEIEHDWNIECYEGNKVEWENKGKVGGKSQIIQCILWMAKKPIFILRAMNKCIEGEWHQHIFLF